MSDANEADLDAARAKITTIRAARSGRALRGLLYTTGTLLLLLGAFAGGYWAGPSSLPAVPVFVGVTAALVLGVTISALTNRGRLEREAAWKGVLREGRRARRVALFADHVTLDREILIPTTIERAEVDGEALVIRYVDPVANGPVLRELTGPRADLARVAGALSSPGSGLPAAPA